jgi:hypothetical protein
MRQSGNILRRGNTTGRCNCRRAAGPLARWADANEASQRAERSAYVTLHQLRLENLGSPTGREPYGAGALVVVRGRESRLHGEGGQVSDDQQRLRGTRDA